MDNKNTGSINCYADLLLKTTNLLNCSYQEIKSKYADYPHCEINYFENGAKDKSIEIRFDEKGITTTCTFNSDNMCDSIFLFSDEMKTNTEFIAYLEELYKYDFINSMWVAADFTIQIKKISWSFNDVCFMVTAKR